jgi:Holliday junction resolvase RusA-like endonuclease
MATYEEIKGSEYKLRYVAFEVDGSPPYKQTPADAREAASQKQRRELLQLEARKAMANAVGEGPAKEPVSISITYLRAGGRADAANIIGGIADGLEGIAYVSDSQVKEVHYVEEPAKQESYSVTVSLR